jgi:hypothetical protein
MGFLFFIQVFSVMLRAIGTVPFINGDMGNAFKYSPEIVGIMNYVLYVFKSCLELFIKLQIKFSGN